MHEPTFDWKKPLKWLSIVAIVGIAVSLYVMRLERHEKLCAEAAELLKEFGAPPYGWDGNAVRVGVAALVRAAIVKVVVNKKPYTNPADPDLVDALRVSRNFDKADLVLEETEVDPDALADVARGSRNATNVDSQFDWVWFPSL